MDKYDEQIKALIMEPEEIMSDWGCGVGLFQMASRSQRGVCSEVGCLTMIRNSNNFVAVINGEEDLELTQQIRADERIPAEESLITIEHLPVFAEWQRKIDKMEGIIPNEISFPEEELVLEELQDYTP